VVRGLVQTLPPSLSSSSFSCSLPQNGVFKALKPHLKTLITEVIFPITCLSRDDLDLWKDDPYDYVRKQFGRQCAHAKPAHELAARACPLVTQEGL